MIRKVSAAAPNRRRSVAAAEGDGSICGDAVGRAIMKGQKNPPASIGRRVGDRGFLFEKVQKSPRPCRAAVWLSQTDSLRRLMTRARCMTGLIDGNSVALTPRLNLFFRLVVQEVVSWQEGVRRRSLVFWRMDLRINIRKAFGRYRRCVGWPERVPWLDRPRRHSRRGAHRRGRRDCGWEGLCRSDG